MCVICNEAKHIPLSVPYRCYYSNFGEAWHSDIPKGMVGALEDRHSYRNWPDGFRWLVRSTYQAQRRIQAWSDHYRSLETDDTTQGTLSLLD